MKNLLFQVKTLDIDQKKVLFLFNFFLKYLIFCTIEFEILVSLSKGFQKNLLVFQKKIVKCRVLVNPTMPYDIYIMCSYACLD